MATLKLHYDGWLALPVGVRQTLDLKTGDRLEADLVDGAIVLRLVNGKRASAKPKKVVETSAAVSAPAPSPEEAAPAKRPRGRPRKAQAVVEDKRQPEFGFGRVADPLPSPKRKPGRPQKVRAEEVVEMPDLEPHPSAETELWKLRPKAELQTPRPEPVPLPLPPRRREATWSGGGYEREERRPFRNVEVRKLGPKGGHTRSRQTAGS